MKRLTLLLLGLAFGVSATAAAQGLTMQMSNGWTFAFAGNVNVFWVFTKQDSSGGGIGRANSSVRTGLLPAFAVFDAKGKEADLDLGIHFGFAPQIQNFGNAHDQFGAQIDMRQVYLTIGGAKWGQILAGRELGLFQRQNILNDMTLFGIGAVGGVQGGGTTLGRIGYGYIYPNFNAQVTYSTPAKNKAQLSIGLFQPSVLAGAGYTSTRIPRVETEVTWRGDVGARNKLLLWVGGAWNPAWTAVVGGKMLNPIGGTGGFRFDLSGSGAKKSTLSIMASAYYAKGFGNLLAFGGFGGSEVGIVGADTSLTKSYGGIGQVTYGYDKWLFGVSWGGSYGKGTSAQGSPLTYENRLYDAEITYQWTKSLKFVGEYGRELSTLGTAAVVGPLPVRQNDISAGFMLFF